MRLIDLDKAIDAIYRTDWYHLFNGELSEGAEDEDHALYMATDIYKAIGEVPVVDSEPVRHGKWKHWARMIICSECGTALYDDVIKCFRGVPRYCPECGAKMDGEKEKQNG